MNFEYVLAVGVGIGVAGILVQFQRTPTLNLANRVKASESQFGKRRTALTRASATAWIKAKLSSANSSKLDRALFELPEIVDLLVVNLRAGDGIYRSFATVIPMCEGELAKEFTRVLLSVQFGAAFGEQIQSVSAAIPQPQVIELTNKIVLALDRGTPLATMLSELGDSARAEIRNRLFRQAGKNETRMLIPLVFLILPITVLFAIYPSLELLNFGFI
jgi:tight adherence protein C